MGGCSFLESYDELTPDDAGSDVRATLDGSPVDDGPGLAEDSRPRDASEDDAGQCAYVEGGAPGAPDPSLSNATHAEATLITSADVDAQGNIYALGLVQDCLGPASDFDIAVFKFTPSGASDTAFGTAGRACIGAPVSASLGSERGYVVRIDPAGNVVVAGTTGNGGFTPVQVFVGRFTPTGQLDGNFASGGVYTALISGIAKPTAYAVAFDRSVAPARIIVAGADRVQFTAPVGGFVLRLTDAGQLDNGFNGGAPITDTNAAGFFGASVDATGNVFVTGSARPQRGPLVVRKWSSSGAPDNLFGTGGRATIPALSAPPGDAGFGEGRGVLVGPNGNVVVGGIQADDGPVFLAQLTPAGALDTSFAAASSVPGALFLTGLSMNSGYEFSLVRARCDGRFLVTGYVGAGASQRMSVARVSTTGTLDSFGVGGFASSSVTTTIPVGAPEDPTTGRVLLIGRDGTSRLRLERYQP